MKKLSTIAATFQYDHLTKLQQALADLTQIAVGNISLEQFLNVLVSRLAQELHAKSVAIMLIEDNRRLVLASGVGWDQKVIGSTIADWDAITDENYPVTLMGPIVINDSSISPIIYGLVPDGVRGIKGAQSVPIARDNRQIGVLAVYSEEVNFFSSDDMTFMKSIASIIAGKLEHENIVEQLATQASDIFTNAIKLNNSLISTSEVLEVLLPNLVTSQIGVIDRDPECLNSLSTLVTQMGFVTNFQACSIESFYGSFKPADRNDSVVVLWALHDIDEVDFVSLKRFLSGQQNLKIMILDHGCGSKFLVNAIRSGVVGYLDDSSEISIKTAVVNVMNHGVSIGIQAVDDYFNQNQSNSHKHDNKYSAIVEQLNVGDIAILQAVANGQSNAEIAENLNFAIGTIKNRLAKIYKNLGVSDRSGAMAFAIRNGVVI